MPRDTYPYQVALSSKSSSLTVAVLATDGDNAAVWMLSDSEESQPVRVTLDGHGPRRLVNVPSSAAFALHDDRGDVTRLAPTEPPTPLDPLLAFCPTLHVLDMDETLMPVGLAADSRLLAPDRVLAKDATSFTSTNGLLIWTTHSHEVKFLPLSAPVSYTHLTLPTKRIV